MSDTRGQAAQQAGPAEGASPSHSRFSDAAWWCVLAIAGLGPMLTSNLTGFGFKFPFTYDQHMLLRAVLVVVASFAASGLASWGNSEGLWSSLHRWPLVAFLGLASLSAAFSAWKGIALFGDYAHYEGLVMFVAYVSLMVTVAQTVTPARLRSFARLSVVIGGLLSVYGLLQMLGLDPAEWLSTTFTLTRNFSTWGNPDFFGMYLILPLTFSAVVALTDERVLWRRIASIAFGFVVLSLIGTVTRGAWLAGVLALGIVVFALTRAGWRPLRLSSVAVIAVAAVIFVAIGGGGRVVSRVASVASASTDTGVGSRFDIWETSLDVASQKPLLGGGPDAYAQTMGRFSGGIPPNDAHNWLIQLAVTVGTPAALALAAFFVWALVSTARRVIAPGADWEDALKVACWGAAAGTLFALLLGLSQSVSTALLFCCVGVLLRDVSQLHVMPRAAMRANAIIMFVLALGAVTIGAIGVAADAEMMKARIAANESPPNIGARLQHAERAVEINPLYERYREELVQAQQAPR